MNARKWSKCLALSGTVPAHIIAKRFPDQPVIGDIDQDEYKSVTGFRSRCKLGICQPVG